MTVYREGPTEELLEFEESGTLASHPHRPVHQASLTYEPAKGLLEVVVSGAETRDKFARLCAESLLRHPPGSPLQLRKFDLRRLLKHHAFDSDPSDRIEYVSLDLLRLKPTDTNAERLVLQTVGRSRGTIWSMAERRFGNRNPLVGGWVPHSGEIDRQVPS
jgi:hypothetical protein